MLKILSNTRKHIARSSWVGWGSIFVMTLAFLVVSIFGSLAYISNLYIQFIEQKSNLLVFFEVDFPEEEVFALQDEWNSYPGVKEIQFTSEEEAFNLYSDFTQIAQPQIFEVLQLQEEKKLPSSLDIQITSLDELTNIKNYLTSEIEQKNDSLRIITTEELLNVESIVDAETQDIIEQEPTEESTIENEITIPEDLNENLPTSIPRYQYSQNPGEPPIQLRVDDENLEQMKEAFGYLRIGGIVAISLLLLVVFFFTFMTVEFRLYNQIDEIGVMQLVGGSLGYIRAPYILEGGIYGFLGAFLSSVLIGGGIAAVFLYPMETGLQSVTEFLYINLNFANLPWPQFGIIEISLVFLLFWVSGFILGAVSSYLSIRRYIR